MSHVLLMKSQDLVCQVPSAAPYSRMHWRLAYPEPSTGIKNGNSRKVSQIRGRSTTHPRIDFLARARFASRCSGDVRFPTRCSDAQGGDPRAPEWEQLSSLMLLMTFGAGLLMRPIGAIVLGAYIDHRGRRNGLLLDTRIDGDRDRFNRLHALLRIRSD